MKPKTKEEFVMVFPAELLHTLGYFHGLHFEPEHYILEIEANASFRRRSAVELDPAYKQLIPYVIIRHGKQVLSYRRGARSSEGRLTGNRSIGVGGHVSASDPNLFTSSYTEAMYRELREEVCIDTSYTIQPVAMLNDDSNDVGKVHFGLIHVLTLDKPSVKSNEQAIGDLKLLSPHELASSIGEYENWSRICIEHLGRLLGVGEKVR